MNYIILVDEQQYNALGKHYWGGISLFDCWYNGVLMLWWAEMSGLTSTNVRYAKDERYAEHKWVCYREFVRIMNIEELT